MVKRRFMMVLAAVLPLLLWKVVSAAPSPAVATCSITVTVADIMEWEANFPAIALSNIASQGASVTGTSMMTLYTNGDVHISANNTTAAQLTGPNNDTLVTEYGLAYDGDGLTNTGGNTVNYTLHNLFLAAPSVVTHVPNDGAVEVTLSVRASNETGTLANAGLYSTTQTLTATWGT